MGEIEGESSIKIVKDESFPKRIRVMAIDDDLFCLKLLEMQLVSCGYEVDVFQHPVSALNTLRKNRGNYDLVITDVRMPGMDGFKLSEIIDFEMDLPVVMISADDEVSTVMDGIKHKACDFILKPTRIEELKLIWKHVLKKSLQKTKSVYPNIIPESESKSKGSLEEEVNSTKQMARFAWRPELHDKFLAAINKLGWSKAFPSKIHALMDVPGLTPKQIASHLQSYRNSVRKNNKSSKQCLSMVNSVGFGANFIDSSSLSFNGQTPKLDTVGYQNHPTTPFSHYQPSNSMNCIKDSKFLPPSTDQQNNSTRPLIRQFGNPQLTSNLSLVPRVQQTASHVNNNFQDCWPSDSTSRPSSTNQHGFVSPVLYVQQTASHHVNNNFHDCWSSDSTSSPSSTNQPGFVSPVLYVQQTASHHVHNNFHDCWSSDSTSRPSSTNQPGFVSPVNGQHQKYNAKTVPNLRLETAEKFENNGSNRISSSELHATFLDHSQNEALFLSTSQSVEDLHAAINPIRLRRQKNVTAGNCI